MKRIQEIWPEYTVDETLAADFVFHDAWDAPIKISGLVPNEERMYYRLAPELASRVNDGVKEMAWHLAGGCARFATDASELCVAAALRQPELMNHMTVCGQSGVELYMEQDGRYVQVGVGRPEIAAKSAGIKPFITQRFTLPGEGLRTFCLYMPLYNGLKKLLIGLPEASKLAAPRIRRIESPITFYGSSITQGGCATKPGACYSAILGRRLDANVRNLGFSGSAKGEEDMVRHLASLEMSVLVLDYDHNAPNAEHLEKTHEPLFRKVREAQPELPVIMLTKPDFDSDPAVNAVRREIVRRTYAHALEAGDRKVWFVDGETLFGESDRDLCTVDGCHPNTLGFLRMADRVEPVLREALGL